ncbi:MAG: S-layer homology domain-containing protein [Carboxydocellales bacterium]
MFLEKYALPDSFAQSADVAVASNGTIYVSDSVQDSVYRFNGTSWTKLGKFGDDDGEFRSPGGLAVDQAGNLFVADINNHRVQKFDSNGVFVAKWGKAGGLLARSADLGEFNAPHGVAVDSNGQVIVADTGNDRIQRWDGSAWEAWDSYGAENGSFLRPYAITVDQSGNVYVADDGSNSIQQFDSKGVFVQKWGKADGSTGTGVGEFNDPAGLVVINNILYVVDFGNHRLQKYDGTAWSILGERGSAAGQFEQPTGITADAGGTLYVADTGNHSIQKYDGAWSVIGELGDDAGQFANPHGVAVTADGTRYVTDTSNDRIQVYQNGTWTVLGGARTAGATGNAGTGVGSFSYPTGIVLDGLGRLFVLDSGNDRIQMLENGQWSAWGGPGSEIGEFDFPNGLAVVDNNTLMIADTDNHRIIRMKAIPTSDSSASVTAESIGKVTQSGTTYRVDITSSKLEEWIQNPAQTREIAIPIPAGMTEAAVGITLEDVTKMRAEKVALNISSAAASLKFSAPDLGKYVGEFGLTSDPKQLKLVVSINRKELTSLPEYQNLAVNKLTILSPAIEFAVAMTDGKRTLPVKQFAEYTKRLIPLPAGITYGPNTTAVSLGQGGRLLHQPTKIITTAERSFAEILSRQNETFVIVSKDATFPDLGSYEWAKETVESMASRMIINGVTVGQKTVFNPVNKAARAEFVTMLMRGMGTYSDQKVSFKDVSEQNSSWSYDYISAAVEAGIIHGYPDQTFKTNQSISREEAMSMLS